MKQQVQAFCLPSSKHSRPILKGVLRLFSFAFFLFLTVGVSAQTVTGTITDASNDEPIVGASIVLKGKNTGTISDVSGAFKLEGVAATDVLQISSVGFTTLEINPNFKTPLSIKLVNDNKQLNEVVVVGYGTQKRSDLTGSVTSVSKSRLSQLPVTNILHAIEGAVAGVNVTTNSSVPGRSANVQVRGLNSITAGTGPLFVVDGIPLSTTDGVTNDINPNDIASMEILKDASAVAIYGVRGSNGVILITTKRGATGKPTIRYNGHTGVEELGHILTPRSPQEYVQKYADYLKALNQTQSVVLPNAYEVANYNAGKTTDWLSIASQQGVIQDHNLSISGGTKDVKYYISGEFMKQKGVVPGYQYQRASMRANLDINVTDYLTTGTSLFVTNNNYDGGRTNFYLAAAMSPYGTVNNSTGGYEIYPMYPELLYTNPMLGLVTDNLDRSKNFNGNMYAEFKPALVKGLKFRVNTSYIYVPVRRAGYSGRDANNTIGGASTFNAESNSWLVENILTYSKSFNKHHIDFTGLYSAQSKTYFQSSLNASGFINDELAYYNIGAGAVQTGGSYQDKRTNASQMGRINYGYDSRYLLTLTARRDGSSVFGDNTTKYGVFPSVGFGWNISKEAFLLNSKLINNLKLRGSYGKTGNEAIGVYGTITSAGSVRFPFSGVSTIGVLASNLGNANLKWENTKGLNLGLDFSILKNRVTGTIDAYKTKTEDLILRRNLPIITGYGSILDNLGKVENKGLEITLNTVNILKGDFKWETSVNFAAYKNKILELYGDGKDDLGNRWFIGQPLSIIYDYTLQGVWQVGEDASSQDPGAKPGDLKFADINGDKKITADDKSILGTRQPKWTGGITNTFHYKNLHLNVFFQTVQGALKNNSNLTFADEQYRMNTPAEIGYWTPENKSNTRPSMSYTNTRGYGYPTDNSYARLKDVTLSYTFPQAALDKMRLGGLTVYASGRNLYTFTKWIGWDPENDFSFRGSGDWTNNYPLVRNYVVGVNVALR
jgi:TonB-linked SusC/RagA family outer membrane protein